MYEALRMKRRSRALGVLCSWALGSAGCETNTLGGGTDGFSEEEWELVSELEEPCWSDRLMWRGFG